MYGTKNIPLKVYKQFKASPRGKELWAWAVNGLLSYSEYDRLFRLELARKHFNK